MNRLKEQSEPFNKSICIIRMESFYRELSPAELELARNHNFNFDHPNAFDFELIHRTLDLLISGKQAQIPDYDIVDYTR
jgi:uridine kinase